ncbi:MAG: tetratricopeptide repeat protein [Bryobacteraceae bacterium]|jgi:TolB-like protein/Flp pilus assembly protein TadD
MAEFTSPKVIGIHESRVGRGAAEAPTGRLDSWKEIAAHLGHGARTVQRWEREEGLPVHRLRHDQGSTVFAYQSELDAWLARQPATAVSPPREQESAASIAVLPFTDMSREKDQEYFCEGMAEEIINALSRLKGLRVASRTSAFQFKNTTADSREIGRRLRVGTLLEGSVRRSENRLRIAVQLTGAESGYQLWAGCYEREIRDIFAIQDEIAQNIVQTLRLTLTAEERGALQKAPTTDVQAYDYYLRGRKFYYLFSRRDVEFAIQLFSQAVELDPAYVLAHAGLADCWSYTYLFGERTETARQHADAASLRAVELDPESAQAQASRGIALALYRRDEEAEKAFEAAIRLDPNLFEAHYFYARHSFAGGDLKKALRLYEQAMRVRPEDYQSPLLVGQIYDDLGRPQDARATRERGVRIAEEHLKLNPNDARAVYMAANGLAALGECERAREWAQRALAMEPDEPMVLYNVGCIYSLLGQVGEAIDCLEKAARNGLVQKGWLDHDSNLDPLRTRPRFEGLLRLLE